MRNVVIFLGLIISCIALLSIALGLQHKPGRKAAFMFWSSLLFVVINSTVLFRVAMEIVK